MTLQHLSTMYARDLKQLVHEVQAYSDEAGLWVLQSEIKNTAGNLCLHLVGNLNHFIGAQLGNTGYVRNRPEEFAAKNVARETMVREVEATAIMVNKVLADLSVADLEKDYPIEMFGGVQKTGYMLIHLLTHLNYHLGQINYHRRLLDKQ